MLRRPYFLLLIVVFACTALWAAAQPTAEELEQQRRQLEVIRKDPDQIARLRENLNAFKNLPDARREAIFKLDHDLRELPAKKQARLWDTLERYADWLEQLRQKDPRAYQAIKDAPDAAARLALVKERRDREWIDSQPKKIRDQWEAQKGEGRVAFVARLRQAEEQRHEQWLIAQRFWRELESKQTMPCRLSDFADNKSDKVKKYVEEYLMPFLSAEEKKQLASAEGRWPDYPEALVEIASKHPSALPPPRAEALPRRITDLPAPVRHRLEDKKFVGKGKSLQKLQPFVGRPNFVSKVVEFGTRDGKTPFEFEFWACNFKSLSPPMREFVDRKLIPALTDSADLKKLNDNEGRWPFYPQAIQELADKHKLRPPWHILPDPDRWKWDLYRHRKAVSWGSEQAKEKKIP